MRLGLCSHRLL